MISHTVKVYPSNAALPKGEQLAWKLAEVASRKVPMEAEVREMVINRIIDDAAVAAAAINRSPVVNARSQALAHPRPGGATLLGLPAEQQFEAEWAAWANGVAVRELDMHDTFLAADYSHPGDNIPPLIAVAQQCGRTGSQLVEAIAVAYEIQIDLVRGICLHQFKKDHIAHLCPAVAAGIGRLLELDTEIIYQAIQQTVHVSFTTRQSRKGEISSWKAYAPAHAGKLAIEAVDRAMRGERSPCPIYEGEDSVIAWMLAGPKATYEVPLPAPGEACHAILESYTKEHSAEYQAQAWIDLALRLRGRFEAPLAKDDTTKRASGARREARHEGPPLPSPLLQRRRGNHRKGQVTKVPRQGTGAGKTSLVSSLARIRVITLHTSHHTHYVIGTGSGDPQKYDPDASRETLDHSVPYIFAAALYTGFWDHVRSYESVLTHDPQLVALWRKVRTVEDPEWTRRYHTNDPSQKAFGGKVVITFEDGSRLTDEIAVADAHPLGARPFGRADYIRKFRTLTEGLLAPQEAERFLATAQTVKGLAAEELEGLNLVLAAGKLTCATRDERGIF